jgi:hypothetical protein
MKVGVAEVFSKVDTTVLIGLSTVKGIFTGSIVREMARKPSGQSSFLYRTYQPFRGRTYKTLTACVKPNNRFLEIPLRGR